MLKRALLVALTIALAFAVIEANPGVDIGVVAEVCYHSPGAPHKGSAYISLIRPATNQYITRKLVDQFGSTGGGLFDVVITPNGRTAIVSNFGDSTIHFVDISQGFSADPVKLGKRRIPFFAEDMAITADGKYVVIADGGFAPRLAVVKIATRSLVGVFDGTSKGMYANSVDVLPDGTIVAADYFAGRIHVLTINSAGTIRYVKSMDVIHNRPVNTAFSPDGKTIVGVNASGEDGKHVHLDMFAKAGLGQVTKKPHIDISRYAGQSFVFSKDGTKGYLLSATATTGTRILVFDVAGPGQVTFSGKTIRVTPARGTSQLFGVDTMAVDPAGEFLWVSNPTLSGGIFSLAVVDLMTNRQVKTVPTHGLPVGIAFTTIE